MRRLGPWPAVAALLVLQWILATTALRDKSTMFDEIVHLTAGYSYWITSDVRLQPEGGMIPQLLQALPLVFSRPSFPSLDRPAWWKSDAYAMGYHFFYDEKNDLGAMLAAGRAAEALLGIPLGLLVFCWSRRLFGTAGGFVSLALYVFCPTMLAHVPAMNSDTAATLFFAASAWAIWVVLHRVTVGTVAASALAVACLFSSKNSAPIIGIAAAIMLAVQALAGRPMVVNGRAVRSWGTRLAILAGVAVVHALAVAALVWTLHGGRYAAIAAPQPGRDTLGWETVTPLPGWIVFARDHRLLPEPYLYAYAYVLHHAQKRRAFLNGEWGIHGWWSYFPYGLLMKTPLTLFLLLGVAGAAGLARRRAGPGGTGLLYETTPLWAFLMAYWAVAVASHLNAGHRHVMPTYPPMYVLAGGAASWIVTRHRVGTAIVGAALVAFVAESFWIRPHYLAYFNVLAGGPRHGYRHQVDSSLDWGQDLPGLARWLARERLPRDGVPVYLSYFGTGKPEYYGIEAFRLPGYYDHWRPPQPWYALRGGIYAVSATMLQTVHNVFPGPWAAPYEKAYQEGIAVLRAVAAEPDPAERARRFAALPRQSLYQLEQLRFSRLMAWLRTREPDDEVGYSILIYRLSDADVLAATEGPPAELVPEPWQ